MYNLWKAVKLLC